MWRKRGLAVRGGRAATADTKCVSFRAPASNLVDFANRRRDRPRSLVPRDDTTRDRRCRLRPRRRRLVKREVMRGEPADALSIETAGLVKRYGAVVALDHVDLTVPRAAVGLLGPNGAGKSTLLRILLGLSRSNDGSARVLGRDTVTDGRELRMRVGYMPETDTLPDNATAADFVTHMAEMSGVPRRAARQ